MKQTVIKQLVPKSYVNLDESLAQLKYTEPVIRFQKFKNYAIYQGLTDDNLSQGIFSFCL
jgi:hypothetical protein